MIDFELIDGPFGIPVHYQRLPVNTMSVGWVVFVGSADDATGGGEGIYHWFEHLPSRGTEKFPGGYRDTEARLVRHGGAADAETGHSYTSFSADVPKRVWADALDVLTDMIARPLLRTGDIEAEREVILQEINEWHSSPYSRAACQLPGVLWPGHPLGHDQLGTAESLRSMDPALLRQAHERGYSRNRCVLVVAGNVERGELLDTIAPFCERIPDRSLSPRSGPASYGELPTWKAGATTMIDTPFDDSVVHLLFPLPPFARGLESLLRWDLLQEVFSAGALGSPLDRLVREDAQLAYSPEFTSTQHSDGGYAGFVTQTGAEPERVLDAFWDLIRSPEIRSTEWLDFVRDTIRGSIEMHDPDASEYVMDTMTSLVHYGRCISDEEYASVLLGYSDDEVVDWLDQLQPEQAQAIVFRGQGSTSVTL